MDDVVCVYVCGVLLVSTSGEPPPRAARFFVDTSIPPYDYYLPPSGEWYVAAGASSLEAYDCQKNRVTRRNATHFQIDEYYQGGWEDGR